MPDPGLMISHGDGELTCARCSSECAYIHPHFTEEETEAQRDQATCPKAHSLLVIECGSNSGQLYSRAHACDHYILRQFGGMYHAHFIAGDTEAQRGEVTCLR